MSDRVKSCKIKRKTLSKSVFYNYYKISYLAQKVSYILKMHFTGASLGFKFKGANFYFAPKSLKAHFRCDFRCFSLNQQVLKGMFLIFLKFFSWNVSYWSSKRKKTFWRPLDRRNLFSLNCWSIPSHICICPSRSPKC